MNVLESEFGQYKNAATDSERQAFWNAVEQETNQLTPEQRAAKQQDIRVDIEHIMQRLTRIQQQLAAAAQPV